MSSIGIALSQVLRQQTHPLHQQLEASSCLPESLTSVGSMVHILEVFHSFYVDVDQWLSDDLNNRALIPPYIARVPLLEADLIEWGFVTNQTLRAYNAAVPVNINPTQLQRIGMRYVVEGSVMGGKIMLRHINKASWRPAQLRTLRYFSLDESVTGISWSKYTAHLNSLPLSQQQQMEVLSGAEFLFTIMIECFERMQSQDMAPPVS